MKTAFTYWDNRIAPVFDIARQFQIVESERGQMLSERSETLPEALPVQKALRLLELGAATVICGAISQPMREVLQAYGIQVIAFVAGDLQEVIDAWLQGKLDSDRYAMPGCCGRGRRLRMGRAKREVDLMSGVGGGQGRGRKGGPLAAGAGGNCVCAKCGHHEPHERGVPCVKKACPKCGTMMTRQ